MFNANLYVGAEELGLEDGGAADSTIATIATEVAEIRAEVAEANAEIQEQGEVIDDVAEQLVNVEEATEEVVDLVEGMESMLASGNFDGKAFAAMYNQAHKTCAKRLGISDKASTRIGAEDLYDASTARTMADAGLEAFMDSVKSGGASVINFIKKIFQSVVSFFVGLFNKNKKLKRRIELLNTDLGKADLKIKEKVKLGGWNGWVDYESKGLENKSLEISGIAAPLSAYATLLDGEITLAEFSTKYSALVTALKSKLAGAGQSKDEKGTLIAQIAGIRVLFHHGEGSPDDLAKAATLARGMSLKTAKDESFKKLASGEAAPKYTAAQLKTILSKVGNGLTALETAKVDEKFSEAKRGKLIGYLNASASKEDKEAGAKVALVKAVCAGAANLSRAGGSLASNLYEAVIDGVAAHI